MSERWKEYALEGLRQRDRHETIRASLTPEEKRLFDEAVCRFNGDMEDPLEELVQILEEVEREAELELTFRRKWSVYIRQEFGRHHNHATKGGCDACGAVQAAYWINPDHREDGPGIESFETWKDRR